MTHASVHAVPTTHCPLALHVSGNMSVWQADVPGTQTPPQAPGAVSYAPPSPITHALAHAVPTTHCPLALQVSGNVSVWQADVPGTPTPPLWPVGPPSAVTHVSGHDVAVSHCPFVPHVCTPLPEHCVEPGTHTPVQAPVAHANEHGEGVPNCPLALQVSTPLPEHVVDPGAHTPLHPPPTQAAATHAVAVPHTPPEEQVC